jgi:hypothetical protein
MTPSDFLQWIPAGAVTLCVYFVHQIVNDFKKFKAKAENNFEEFEKTRASHLDSVRGYSLQIAQKVDELRIIHSEFKAEVEIGMAKIGVDLDKITFRADQAKAVFEKALQLAQVLNQKVKKNEDEISSIKIQLGKSTMFKGKKN